MYGVPKDLPLQRFVGDTLLQIAIGVDGVHFIFGKAGTVSVSGRWELRDKNGMLLDESKDNQQRQEYRVHVVLNADVSSYAIDAPRSFSLLFSTGHELKVFDDTSQYESFAIEPGGINV